MVLMIFLAFVCVVSFMIFFPLGLEAAHDSTTTNSPMKDILENLLYVPSAQSFEEFIDSSLESLKTPYSQESLSRTEQTIFCSFYQEKDADQLMIQSLESNPSHLSEPVYVVIKDNSHNRDFDVPLQLSNCQIIARFVDDYILVQGSSPNVYSFQETMTKFGRSDVLWSSEIYNLSLKTPASSELDLEEQKTLNLTSVKEAIDILRTIFWRREDNPLASKPISVFRSAADQDSYALMSGFLKEYYQPLLPQLMSAKNAFKIEEILREDRYSLVLRPVDSSPKIELTCIFEPQQGEKKTIVLEMKPSSAKSLFSKN